VKINENKAIATACKRMSTSTQKFKRPDLVYETVNPETGKIKWELVEITCLWPWIDYDGKRSSKPKDPQPPNLPGRNGAENHPTNVQRPLGRNGHNCGA
jgi:hypothetical protein